MLAQKNIPLGENVANPDSFGDYKLLKQLGKGAMGTVWKAEERLSRRIVALKVLNLTTPEDKKQTANENLNKEARLLGSLNHRNLIACHAFGEVDGIMYMAMEFISGETLHEHLKNAGGVLPEKYALRLVKEVVRGVGYAHRKGIIHRDVKPGNIFLGADGSVKLSDFGVAKTLKNETLQPNRMPVVGSPNYMPPEQIRADKDVDHRADFYALGVTLYQLLTGEVPFKGTTAKEIMLHHLGFQPTEMSQLNPKLSSGCRQIVQCLMSKNREHRYYSPIEIMEDIEAVLEDKSPQNCNWIKEQSSALQRSISSKQLTAISALSPKKESPRPAASDRYRTSLLMKKYRLKRKL